MTDERVSITIKLTRSEIEDLQEIWCYRPHNGSTFEQRLQSTLETSASTIAYQKEKRSVERRRESMHVVGDDVDKPKTLPDIKDLKIEDIFPEWGKPISEWGGSSKNTQSALTTRITLSEEHREWLLKQMNLQERNFPTRINRFGKPKSGKRMGLPWLCEQIINEVLEDWISRKPFVNDD